MELFQEIFNTRPVSSLAQIGESSATKRSEALFEIHTILLYDIVIMLQLSKSSEQVLGALFESDSPLFVNEIVRQTKQYPNSVQRSLLTLEKQDIVTSQRLGNKKFYSLNKNHSDISAIRLLTTKITVDKKRTPTWIKLVNRETSVALNAAVGIAQSKTKYIKRFKIKPMKYIWYNSVTGGVYDSQDEIVKNGEILSREIKKDYKFAKYLADSCLKDGESLIRKTKESVKKDLPRLTNRELILNFKGLYENFLNFLPYLNIPHSVETAIETELNSKIFDNSTKEKLLEPTEVVSEEQIDELRLASLVKKEGWTKKNKRLLIELTEKYCWLPMMALHHKPFDEGYYRKIVEDLVVRIKSPKKEITKLRKQEQVRKDELKKTLQKINADEDLTRLVNLAQAYIKLRTYRINVIRKFHFYHLPLLNEIANRIDISKENVTFLSYDEILKALLDRKTRNRLKREISKRQTGFAILGWRGKTRVISGVENIIHAMEQYNIFSKTPDVKKEIKGNPACRGIVTGKVKIVKKLSELGKVTKGDVLVAKMTTPDYMIAINKAAAIVTDEGGITCHAAIVSREFNVPCIVGTRNATQVLSDNDLVEVDANEGVVRVIESVDLPEDLRQLQGKTIFKGKVKGTARVILDASDFDKLQEGDIVVAPQTTPEYLSLLYRAKGFIVDEESISSHAVLYGKALEMPSIMGTSFARSVIKDGEKIELDATNGFVRRLQI